MSFMSNLSFGMRLNISQKKITTYSRQYGTATNMQRLWAPFMHLCRLCYLRKNGMMKICLHLLVVHFTVFVEFATENRIVKWLVLGLLELFPCTRVMDVAIMVQTGSTMNKNTSIDYVIRVATFWTRIRRDVKYWETLIQIGRRRDVKCWETLKTNDFTALWIDRFQVWV